MKSLALLVALFTLSPRLAAAESKPAAAPSEDAVKRARTLREKALHLYQQNDFEGAQEWLGKSLKLNDQDAEAHKLYGAALAATGDIDQALAHYKRYLKLAPPTDRNYSSVKDTVEKFEQARGPARR